MSDFVTADMSGFERFGSELVALITEEAILQVSRTHTRVIVNLTQEGYDAQSEKFHDYNPEYAKRLAIPRQPKTLRRNEGRLYDLQLDDDTLTVPEDAQKIALGQMTGHGGDWGYEHDFLDTSEETDILAGEELTEYIAEAIGA